MEVLKGLSQSSCRGNSSLNPSSHMQRRASWPSVVGEGWALLCLHISPLAYQAGARETQNSPFKGGCGPDTGLTLEST